MTSCRRFSTLVVVDSTVADYPTLLNGIPSDAYVLLLNQEQDGVEQITQTLASIEAVDSIHILSHGSSGVLHLGAVQLSGQTLAQYASHLQTWAKKIKQGAEILLYGCEVAAGTVGRWFVQQLKSLTGAEIAASTNLTGHASLGGDWQLEFKTGNIHTPILFSDSAIAAYPHTLAVFVSDTFRGSDVTDKNWKFRVGSPVSGSDQPINPFLTARDTDVAPAGGLPGNPSVQLDAAGEGALRLTDNRFDQSAFVLYDRAIDSRQGLTITFELFSYGGTATDFADGVSFFLVDGQFSPDQAGAFGGSLGYAQKNTTPSGSFVPGLQGAYVGIGLDEFGNFSSATDFTGGPVVRTGGPARISDSISVRAGAGTSYQYITGTGSLPFGIDNPTATTRDQAKRTVNIELTTEGLLTVRIDGNNDGDFLDEGESASNLTNINLAQINGTLPPSTLKFGFASGTGTFNNIHEIRNLVVSTRNDPPSANDFEAAIVPGSTSVLPGFSATDPNIADGDSVASYTIVTLPDATQGALYLGDPSKGGTAVTAGQTFTPEQIQNIYFQATSGFSTTATFTYTATDERGASDATPATVTLTAQGRPPGGDNLAPDTSSSSLTVDTNKTARVPGLDGTDPDGNVASFTILTLPPQSQGRLFLGDPRDGGKPITVGQVLTPDQLQQVFFRSSANFSGSRFTYAATDNEGASDLTPAIVSLNLKTAVEPEVCEVGITRKGNGRKNKIDGTPNIDTLRGLNGNDRLRGFDCNDLLDGGRGNDKLAGGAARDRLRGRQNRDVARGNAGNDVIDLGLGIDKGFGGKGNDIVYGRRGNDTIDGKGGDDTLRGGRGRDTIQGATNNDTLDGQQGDDLLRGGKGSDLLNGGLGRDKLRGTNKNDVIFARRGDDVAWGGGGKDTLLGQKGNDRLSGNTQRDQINGAAGDDVITGGGGNDVIRTGAGADRIRYRSATHGTDRILDLDVTVDVIDLRDIFAKAEYTSDNAFADYVRLSNGGSGAVLRVDSDGGTSGNFVRLAILRGVEVSGLSAETNFLV